MGSVTAKPHVLIIGGGLGGLLLAQGLRKYNISCEVFERDDSPVSRTPGWAIAIHSLRDDILSIIPDDLPPLKQAVDHLMPLNLDAEIGIYSQGQRAVVRSTPEAPIIRANRFRFREWLSTNVTIRWGKRATRVEELKEELGGGVRVHFEDGTTAAGDIVVGADGVNSIVREHVLQRPNKETLSAIPAVVLVGEATMSGDAFLRQLSLGHSCYMTNDPVANRYFIFVGLRQVADTGDSGRYYWLLVSADPTFTGDGKNSDGTRHWTSTATKPELLARALEMTSTMDPKFTEVIRSTTAADMLDGPMVIRDVSADISDLPVSRVTLLGDAIHPMSPFRGEGAMHAFRDAIALAKALGKLTSNDWPTIKEIIGAYQKEIVQRGGDAARASRNALKVNSGGHGTMFAWGQPAAPAPEKVVTFESIRT